MTREEEILFMQVRLIRLASEKWGMAVGETAKLFRKCNVLEFISDGYDEFHCEGDVAVLNEVEQFLQTKGVDPYV